MEERTLRDELAIERTLLADERTQLAYIRTGVSLMLGGIFFIGYFPPGTIFSDIGYATIVVAFVFLGYGFYHHKKTIEVINKIMKGIFEFKP